MASTPSQSSDHHDSAPELGEDTPLLPNSSPPETPRIVVSRVRGIALGISLWIMILMQTTNFSGMTMVQGAIAEDLNAQENPMWLSSSFFIPVSALAPFVGRLATIFPARSLLLPTAVLTAIGSLVSAFAQTTHVFMLGRVLSGAGCAGVLPLVVVFVLELTTGKSRGTLVGLVNAGATVGVALGAFLYGALLPSIGWRPLFWIQAPVAFIAGIGAYLTLPAEPSSSDSKPESLQQKLKRIDYLGAFLLVLTIVLFLYGLADVIELLPLLLSLASLAIFIVVETYYAAEPIIPLNVLFSPGVLLTCFSQLGMMSARWSMLFYSPTFMLAVRGAAPATAGSILIPTNLGFGLGGIIVGWLHVRTDGAFYLSSIVSLLLFSVSIGLAAIVGTTYHSIWYFILVSFANGFAAGAALNYTLAHLLHVTKGRDAQYVATSLLATFRSFAGSFGTTIGGGIFYRLLRTGLVQGFLDLDHTSELSPSRRQLVSRLLKSPNLVFGGGLEPPAREVAVEGYAGAIQGLWQAAAALALIMVILQAQTGWSLFRWRKRSEDREEEARINVTEHETVAEA